MAHSGSETQIIGGVFGLAELLPVRDAQPPFLGERDFYLVNARMAKKHIVNYQELARALRAVALFPNLPPGVVPVGFPIRVEKRDMLRRMLFEHEIYPPVHWPIEGIVPESYQDSHRLAANIMTLPCDQRYTTQDMQRMADLVRSGLEQ